MRRIRWWVLIVGILGMGPVYAALQPTPVPGQSFAEMTLADANGHRVQLPADYHFVVFASDMDGADIIKGLYADGEQDPFTPRQAVYVADISGMPKAISTLFAKPAMRKYPYPVLLDESGNATASWPKKEGALTFIQLHNGQVERLFFCSDPECVKTWAADHVSQ